MGTPEEGAPTEGTQGGASRDRASRECKTILVVEDSRDIRKMLILLLQTRVRARILGASEGRTALHFACRERPDLILMDIMLPEMDGLETTRRLKAEPKTAHIPVVAVSDLCIDKEWKDKALAAGCERGMSKMEVLDNLSDLVNLITATLDDPATVDVPGQEAAKS